MGYFPLFVDLEGVPCLIAGAGKVALRKVKALLPCNPQITVAAPQALPEFHALAQAGRLRLLQRAVQMEDITGQQLVVAATGDRSLNEALAARCRAEGIWVNAASSQEACTCKFPAVVRRDGVTIGISTGGASPTAALCIKEKIEAALPAGSPGGLEEILDYLAHTRDTVKARIPEGALRSRIFAALFDQCVQRGRSLSEQEFETVLEEAVSHE